MQLKEEVPLVSTKKRSAPQTLGKEQASKRQRRQGLEGDHDSLPLLDGFDEHSDSFQSDRLEHKIDAPAAHLIFNGDPDFAVRWLCERVNNFDLRLKLAEEIGTFLYSSYQGSSSSCSAEDHAIQKILTSKIRVLFHKLDTCTRTLQEQINTACSILGEAHPTRNPDELLDLSEKLHDSLEEKCISTEMNALTSDDDSSDDEEHQINPLRDVCETLGVAMRELVIRKMAIEAWCSQKEIFLWYVQAFSSRACAFVSANPDLMSEVGDLALEEHYLGAMLKQMENKNLGRAMITWENQVERFSLEYQLIDRGERFHPDLSIVHSQLNEMKRHWHSALESSDSAALRDIRMVPVGREHVALCPQMDMNKYFNYAQLVSWIFGKWANIEQPEPTPLQLKEGLFVASKLGHMHITLFLLKHLLRNGAISDDLDDPEALFTITLENAIEYGLYALLNEMLQHVTPTNLSKNNYGSEESYTLLQVAALNGKSHSVRCILDHIEENNFIERSLQGNKYGPCDIATAAMYAAEFADNRTFDILYPYLQYNPNCVNISGPADDEAPFRIAVAGGSHHIVTCFIRLGANPYIKNREGAGPMDTAVENGDLELVKLLIKSGIDINRKYNGATALMLATEYNQPEIVHFLINNLADVSLRNNKGQTAAMIASCRKNGGELAKYLIEKEKGQARKNVVSGVDCIHRFFRSQQNFPVSVVREITSYMEKDFGAEEVENSAWALDCFK